MTVVVYPGTFDPITNGHLDVIHRAARLFNRVIVAVAESRNKRPLFSHQERVEMVRQAVQDVKNVEVEGFTGLLIEYVHRKNANAVLRGLRAVSDFEFEFQLALVNRKLSKDFETIFMMPNETYTFLSSSVVKELAWLGADVSALVPPHVKLALELKFGRNKTE
jgi:pantetheine-phosphate adenylyltransferase